jgi:O-antigen/teichoic acid export membrane protein
VTTSGGPGWEGGVAGRVANLAGARVVAQALGLGWFLFAARELGPREFGLVSTGLALVMIIGGLSDLGTTRTVVRHVAADPTALRSNFVRAGVTRAVAGIALGTLFVLGLRAVAPTVPVEVSALAAVVAAVSGLTEVGFAALRATGRVGTEVALLVGERALFVVAGVALLVVRQGRGGGAAAGPLLDGEGRSTAVSSTLVIVGPRVSVLILVVLSTPTVLGAFTIAQKVPEALGTLGTAALMPVLPLLRAALVGGRWPDALDRAGRITAAVAAALAPVVAWLVLDGRRAMDLLFDAGDRRGVAVALSLLSVAALLWVIRTLGEMVLLAEERAGTYLRALSVGLVVNVAVGVPLVSGWGTAGAAGATLAGEVAVLSVVLVAVRASRQVLGRPLVAVAVTSAVGVAVALGGRSLPVPVAVAAVGLVSATSLAVTARSLIRLPRGAAPSESAGHDADVGAEVGGYLGGDGIETVEHGSGPAQHL